MSEEKEKLPDSSAAAEKVDSDEREKKGACPEDPAGKVEAQPIEDSSAATNKVDSDERRDQGSYSENPTEKDESLGFVGPRPEDERLREDSLAATKKVDSDEREKKGPCPEDLAGKVEAQPVEDSSAATKKVDSDERQDQWSYSEKAAGKNEVEGFQADQAETERLRGDIQGTQQQVARLQSDMESYAEQQNDISLQVTELRNVVETSNGKLDQLQAMIRQLMQHSVGSSAPNSEVAGISHPQDDDHP